MGRYADADSFVELMNLLGVVLSVIVIIARYARVIPPMPLDLPMVGCSSHTEFLAASNIHSGIEHHGVLFLAVTSLYHFLVIFGLLSFCFH